MAMSFLRAPDAGSGAIVLFVDPETKQDPPA
jgi:hypothetical protein